MINGYEKIFFLSIRKEIKRKCKDKGLKVETVVNNAGLTQTGYSLAIKNCSLKLSTFLRICDQLDMECEFKIGNKIFIL